MSRSFFVRLMCVSVLSFNAIASSANPRADNAIVGKASVDITPALAAVGNSKNAILIAIDTCCESIHNEFNSVFTALDNLTITATIDLSGVFTALEQCCESIHDEFNSVFTALDNITITATIDLSGVFTALDACCESIHDEFNSVFTVLDNLTVTATADLSGLFTALEVCCESTEENFSGVFTALEACCESIHDEFSGLFTVLDTISITATADISGIFTALEACCESIHDEFNGVFTAIDALVITVTADISGLFTALEVCCESAEENFSGIFTALEACCVSIHDEFSGVFTALDTLHLTATVDFSELFTALASFCESIQEEFSGVFTVLDNITFDITTTIDINMVLTAIEACCESNEENFSGVFTALEACCESIQQEFSDLFTTLDHLTITATVDLSGVFTVLQACCESIADEFSGVFTLLDALPSSDVSGIYTALEACCESIADEFGGVFTTIDALIPPCGPTVPISAPTTISAPGSYCVVNDIAGQITITADRVELDLNGKTISGASPCIAVTGENITITNGFIEPDSGNTGITINAFSKNITLDALSITGGALGISAQTVENCRFTSLVCRAQTSQALVIEDNSLNITLHDIACYQITTAVSDAGIVHITTTTNIDIDGIIVEGSNRTGGTNGSIIRIDGINNATITNCYVYNNTSSAVCRIWDIQNSTNATLTNCLCYHNTCSNSLIVYALNPDTTQSNADIILKNCQAILNASSTADLTAFSSMVNEKISFQNCICNNNSAITEMTGFTIEVGNLDSITQCIVEQNTGNVTIGINIDSTSTNCNIKNNIVAYNTGTTSAVGLRRVGATSSWLFSNQSSGHTTNNYDAGTIPLTEFDPATGTFTPFTMPGPTLTQFDNISVV